MPICLSLPGDLLENYCKDDDLMNAARFGFAITIMLTYPIECFVTREVGILIFISLSVSYLAFNTCAPSRLSHIMRKPVFRVSHQV